MTEILSATIYDLEPSPQNPRKRFDPAELEELGRSIAEKGIIEPLVVRRHPKKKGKWEIVCGERRWRAAKIAGTETVSCIVRELDDVEVLEIQTIENIQRDDLHPLEEADGYARLMKRPGYDVGRIARKVGRSEKYVYDRVKLLQLTPQAKKLFLEDRFTAGHAILLALKCQADPLRPKIGGGLTRRTW